MPRAPGARPHDPPHPIRQLCGSTALGRGAAGPISGRWPWVTALPPAPTPGPAGQPPGRARDREEPPAGRVTGEPVQRGAGPAPQPAPVQLVLLPAAHQPRRTGGRRHGPRRAPGPQRGCGVITHRPAAAGGRGDAAYGAEPLPAPAAGGVGAGRWRGAALRRAPLGWAGWEPRQPLGSALQAPQPRLPPPAPCSSGQEGPGSPPPRWGAGRDGGGRPESRAVSVR